MKYPLDTSIDTFYSQLNNALSGFVGKALFFGKTPYFIEINKTKQTFIVYFRRFFSMRIILKGHIIERDGQTIVITSSPLIKLFIAILCLLSLVTLISISAYKTNEALYYGIFLVGTIYQIVSFNKVKKMLLAKLFK